MNAYAYARKDESTHELSYAIAIFDDRDCIYAANGRLGFGELVHGAAIAMHRLLTYIIKEGINPDNIYTNVHELLKRYNSKIIQDELIQELRALEYLFGINLMSNVETKKVHDLFTTSFSIFTP
jgi:hypothetical protein